MDSMIWRVNLNRQTVDKEPVPETWQRIGGRGLVARVLLDEVPPMCDALGPSNKLLLAPGLLVGHMVSSCDRLSFGFKSPLTGGVKESNVGGLTGSMVARLGAKAIILEGRCRADKWCVLYLSPEEARFDPADDLLGLGVYETGARLIERYGKDSAAAMIGPGGELELSGAGISNLDMDRTPTRIAARGGGGAVMGGKRLKAIVLDGEGGRTPPIQDEELFKSARRRFIKALLDHPQTKSYAEFGTAAILEMVNAYGALPTRGFSDGQFEATELIGGDRLHDTILERGGEGKTTLPCMPGCVIRSSNVFADMNGKSIVSTLQYETIAMCGSNLGISDLDTIARINYVLNDLGMDSIEMGAALGVAAQAGLLDFGDGDGVMKLLAEVRQGTPLGRIIGHGAATVGKIFGIRRIPVVKGQAMPGYDPRAVKGTGITYATSPQGADHTCGLTIRANVDHLAAEGQAELSLNAQINMAGYDTLGACIFTGFGFASAPGAIRDLVKARFGWDLGDGVLQKLGKETLLLERAFNRAAGLTSVDDRLPAWMTEEPLPPHGSVFDVSEDDLDGLFESIGELPYN